MGWQERRKRLTKKVKVAVYGTLKSIHNNHNLLGPEAKVLQSDVLIPGFSLYNLGWFPGVVRDNAGGGVECEVVEVPVGRLDYLDAYEGYNPESPATSLFLRERVRLPNGEQVFMYTYNRDVPKEASIINDGRWLPR